MIRFDRDDIELLADYFLDFFKPNFIDQKLGSLSANVQIEVSKRMTSKIGLALLFENKIRLNESYFVKHPHYLPYTLFHELTHLWLYHCGLDPGHTRRFYDKMEEFRATGYLVDPEIHIHTRLSPESRFIYRCTNCKNRWHLKDSLDHHIFCGLCWRREKTQHFAELTEILEHEPESEFEDNMGARDCA
ncbi:MAG: SprT-like domain-containing protein [Proteobacteria bacterium]|nr:SprT-like domain-containing protein [Pseudomonadota bacterium]